MTIHERVAEARVRLARAGVQRPDADLDARLIAQWLLDWDATTFLTRGNEEEPDSFPPRYDASIARRAAREPLAYVTGRREFWGRTFEVTPAVLIPRPETETIVEAALELQPDQRAALQIADVGTGSGCLAVTLAAERPNASTTATDLSAEALAVARRNAAKHAVAERIEFITADLLAGVERTFDVIVANPPYVPDRDRHTLQPEVRDHEPPAALFAPADGLGVIARLLEQAPARLKPAGRLIFEFGYGQAGAVRSAIAATPELELVEMRADLQRIPRIAIVGRSVAAGGKPMDDITVSP
jgi:release factor glutamine methyltransferase